MSLNETFSVNLREAIEKYEKTNAKKLTQTALAEMAGATQSAVSKWLNGKACPPLDQCVKIADALNASLDWLTGRDAETEKREITGGDWLRHTLDLLEKTPYVASLGVGPYQEYVQMMNLSYGTPDCAAILEFYGERCEDLFRGWRAYNSLKATEAPKHILKTVREDIIERYGECFDKIVAIEEILDVDESFEGGIG